MCTLKLVESTSTLEIFPGTSTLEKKIQKYVQIRDCIGISKSSSIKKAHLLLAFSKVLGLGNTSKNLVLYLNYYLKAQRHDVI